MGLHERDDWVNGRGELRILWEENARLKELLTRHGISWEVPVAPETLPGPPHKCLASYPNQNTGKGKGPGLHEFRLNGSAPGK